MSKIIMLPALSDIEKRHREMQRKNERLYPWVLLFMAVVCLFMGVWLGSILEMERTYNNCSKHYEHFLSSRLFEHTVVVDCLVRGEKTPAPSRDDLTLRKEVMRGRI